MAYEAILFEKRGHVAILTLNRPDSMNALGAPGDGDQVQAVYTEALAISVEPAVTK